jgi:hypothetical protein
MFEQLELFSLDYSEHKYCEWCNQSLDELMSPNVNELCIDCTGEAEWIYHNDSSV